MKYNERGEELPDPTEVEMPTGLRRPPTLAEQIKAMVRGELSRAAQVSGSESFEEADDFEVGDDDDMIESPHEMSEEQEFRDASDLESGGPVRGKEEPVSGAPQPGVVQPGEGRKDVPRGDAGGGAPAVPAVESAAGVRQGGQAAA